MALPPEVDEQRLRAVLGRYFERFVAGGLAALATGEHNDQWLQFGLALNPGHGTAVHARLRALAARLLDDGAVLNFFYMHKPPGLRIRFEVVPGRRDELADRIEDELSRWQADVAEVRRGRYEPEDLLFGGPTSMGYVHALFTVDSQCWLDYFGLPDRPPPWMFSLAILRHLLNGLTISNWEDLNVWERVRRQAYRGIPDALDKHKVAAATGMIRTLWGDQDALRTALGEDAAALAAGYGARILDCAQRWNAGCFAVGDSLIGPREAAAFATIFHWNRGRLSAVPQGLIATALSDRSARP
ncbi:MAG TPA: thiopeptide-type bacteriocin biosynthesis protein [Streptosporangiaceae bacterium]|nr:thiopeptide-type bacteriocin biosynthesis protein [Streptosporangiaceae bacterium]